jgi:hypothetical protein
MNSSFRRMGSLCLAACTLCFGPGAASASIQEQARGSATGKQATDQKGFYCNIKALTPAERARHALLTHKLLAARTETVETEKGYELQYRAGSITLAELAEWAFTESKCCPFLDFHIDLENEGQLLCLRLTGREGIKAFIRADLHLDGKRD